ncbi:sorting nexin-17 [Vespa crabro]|uniref:sorting nexin-17 n=1 Tax=Vespa crabro TaxID=7445 RepID=UPI001F01AEDB|nr:sorting nexin-17 [Vespa crabro]
MHFSIPDTQEFLDAASNTYVGYNIHINGLFHCTVRYKQLLNLHEQLVKDVDIPLPTFPPKKFFPLTMTQQEERRVGLEKYIQTIGQDPVINSSELLNGFLLNAQQEAVNGPFENEYLDVFLSNDYKVTINVSTKENSGQVLKKVYDSIMLLNHLHHYFALFIIVQEDNNAIVLRKLQDFESPVITYKNMCTLGIRVVLGRNYWDIEHDLEILDDSVGLSLLYNQTVAEIQRGWILITDEVQNCLENLQKNETKKEYMKIARTLKYYGYVQFIPCFCDYPQSESKVIIAIGKNELNLRVLTSDPKPQEIAFKVTRMRCWRITTSQNGIDRYNHHDHFNLELSFEYLIAKNQLQWITISSDQAILMSVCLQSMIDELLLKSTHGNKHQEPQKKSWTYIMRDGHSRIVMGAGPIENIDEEKQQDEVHSTAGVEPIIKKLTDRLSIIKLKKSSDDKTIVYKHERGRTRECDIVENNAFYTIGDEDL